MEPEEYEITVAVEALRDLQSQNKEGLDPINADGTEKVDAVASVSGHTVVLGASLPGIIIQDTITTRKVYCQAGSEDRGEKCKSTIKNPLQNSSKGMKGISLPSNLQMVSLAFPLRDSQKRRILLPKPTATSNVVSIPLSSLISQTIGIPPPQVIHSKSIDDSTLAVDVSCTSPGKKKRQRKEKRGGIFACSRCSTTTTTRQALWKHKRRFHSNEPQEKKAVERVSCNECETYSCKTLKELLLHYNKAHSKKLRVLCKEFPSERDFKVWKKQTEKMCGSWFVLSNGKKVYEHHTTRYYYCNKSGFSKGKGIRTSKRAVKIEGKCCAYMRKKEDRNTGRVTVEYSLDHVGHVTKLGLTLLPAEISDTITKWHSTTKADVDSFISEIYVKATGLDTLTVTIPESLTCLKQSRIPKDQLERDALTRMVTELRSRKDNPVLIYKPQGDVEHEMSSEDFVVGIQTQFQREMLKKHANKMICAHVSESEDSFLMTLLVIDKESEDVIPVCWLLGSVQESKLFKPFLDALKAKCGDIETDLFVTNLSSTLYHIWTDTFSKPWRKLDCSWHVDEDWRTNLQLYIPDTENQLVVYAYLKTLQYEGDEIHFRKILQEFMTFLGEVSLGFKCFFSNNYLLGERCSHWALCFRKGLPSHKNINLDGALHDGMKDVILQALQYSKTTDLLLALLKLSRDITVVHFARHTRKGKGTQTARDMKSHHAKSVTLDCDYFNVGDGVWSVSSSSDCSVNYVLRRVLCDCHCKLRCQVCGVCIHIYSCSCIEFLLGSLGCEHVHIIHMANEADKTPMGNSSPVVEVEEGTEGASLQNMLQVDQGSGVKYLRKEALKKLKDLEKSLKGISDEDVLKRICSQINAAMDTAGEIQVPEDHAVNLTHNLLS